jgi:hypothetical protein
LTAWFVFLFFLFGFLFLLLLFGEIDGEIDGKGRWSREAAARLFGSGGSLAAVLQFGF